MGAQDTSTHDHGAYTGEVSAQMIAETGAKYVIVGHSERRQYHGETNNIVQQKAAAAMAAGLIPIICIGETMDEKQSGIAMQVIESGVRECVPPNTNKNIIIAYEPRWAIGAGITPTDDEIAAAHKLIADTLSNMGLTNIPIKRRWRIGWWRVLETGRFHTYNNQCQINIYYQMRGHMYPVSPQNLKPGDKYE